MPKSHNTLVDLLKAIVKVNLISFLFVYFFFAIAIVCVGNRTKCDRLEANYVICQQYKTSLDLILMESFMTRKLVALMKLNKPKISYRLTGTIIANNNLYLQTDGEPVLYITKISKWAKEYPMSEIRDFIDGKGDSKLTLSLENSRNTFITYSISCLIPVIFIMTIIYYLDKQSNNKSKI